MLPVVTVATITRGRPDLLLRAIRSLAAQDYQGSITHRILVDDCAATASMLEELQGASSYAFVSRSVHRNATDMNGPARLARLRNVAVHEATTDYIAFLDDDNELEEAHISSLVECAMSTGCRAVHSWRRLYCSDGSPYLDARMPWKRDPEEGKQLYDVLRAKGVFVEGSNIVCDRADPRGYPDPVQMVDMGEWLFDRTLLLELPFCEQYTHQDWLDVIPEDNKLLQTLVDREIRIESTKLPTLRYYLGGYSNAFVAGSTTSTTSSMWIDDELT